MIGALITFLRGLVGQIVVGLGLTFVSYKGLGLAAENLLGLVQSHLSALPPEALTVLRLLRIADALNLVASAAISRVAVRGLTRLTAKGKA